MSWSREEMIRRSAMEVQPGTIVNLGIGMPTEVANFIPLDGSVTLHSENGLLGMGRCARSHLRKAWSFKSAVHAPVTIQIRAYGEDGEGDAPAHPALDFGLR